MDLVTDCLSWSKIFVFFLNRWRIVPWITHDSFLRLPFQFVRSRPHRVERSRMYTLSVIISGAFPKFDLCVWSLGPLSSELSGGSVTVCMVGCLEPLSGLWRNVSDARTWLCGWLVLHTGVSHPINSAPTNAFRSSYGVMHCCQILTKIRM
jgi:hypothetical protein